KSLLPNIDNVFKHQNQQIVELTEQTEMILLPQTFNSLSEDDFLELYLEYYGFNGELGKNLFPKIDMLLKIKGGY
ncbi:MAG TPA: hypothetical protein ACHBX0_05690, partial [Arsenophonus sp.]